ncbi:MAG: hypothetical protein HOW73_12430 [Polyangiaceae bacterium]|nr:hypothetical protein [Polyangiaceae bacterium]
MPRIENQLEPVVSPPEKLTITRWISMRFVVLFHNVQRFAALLAVVGPVNAAVAAEYEARSRTIR